MAIFTSLISVSFEDQNTLRKRIYDTAKLMVFLGLSTVINQDYGSVLHQLMFTLRNLRKTWLRLNVFDFTGVDPS